MRRLTEILRLTLAVLVLSVGMSVNAWAETRFGLLRVVEGSYLVPLPDGFCDLTESLWGIQTLSFLKKMSVNNSAFGQPKVIFRLCNAKEKNPFPWGYVASFPKNKFINNQKSFNKLRRRLFEDKKVIKDIVKKAINKNKESMRTYGLEVGDFDIGKPKITREDDNVSIVMVITNTQVNGVPYREFMITATTVINGRMIQLVTFDEVGNFLNPKAFNLDLTRNAARFKSMN